MMIAAHTAYLDDDDDEDCIVHGNMTVTHSHPLSSRHIPTWWDCGGWEFAGLTIIIIISIIVITNINNNIIITITIIIIIITTITKNIIILITISPY